MKTLSLARLAALLTLTLAATSLTGCAAEGDDDVDAEEPTASSEDALISKGDCTATPRAPSVSGALRGSVGVSCKFASQGRNIGGQYDVTVDLIKQGTSTRGGVVNAVVASSTKHFTVPRSGAAFELAAASSRCGAGNGRYLTRVTLVFDSLSGANGSGPVRATQSSSVVTLSGC